MSILLQRSRLGGRWANTPKYEGVGVVGALARALRVSDPSHLKHNFLSSRSHSARHTFQLLDVDSLQLTRKRSASDLIKAHFHQVRSLLATIGYNATEVITVQGAAHRLEAGTGWWATRREVGHAGHSWVQHGPTPQEPPAPTPNKQPSTNTPLHTHELHTAPETHAKQHLTTPRGDRSILVASKQHQQTRSEDKKLLGHEYVFLCQCARQQAVHGSSCWWAGPQCITTCS
jgi:hypothetical protein